MGNIFNSAFIKDRNAVKLVSFSYQGSLKTERVALNHNSGGGGVSLRKSVSEVQERAVSPFHKYH